MDYFQSSGEERHIGYLRQVVFSHRSLDTILGVQFLIYTPYVFLWSFLGIFYDNFKDGIISDTFFFQVLLQVEINTKHQCHFSNINIDHISLKCKHIIFDDCFFCRRDVEMSQQSALYFKIYE